MYCHPSKLVLYLIPQAEGEWGESVIVENVGLAELVSNQSQRVKVSFPLSLPTVVFSWWYAIYFSE